MADYNITLSNGTDVITITEGAPNTNYTVPLVGQNQTTYGDDIAQAFLHLLENFASPTEPQSNSALVGSVPNTVLPGQLWYDSGNGILNVNTSATATTSPSWSPIASTAQAATTDSTLRWDGTNWVESSRVRSSSVGVFSIWEAGATPTDNVAFSHNGSQFLIQATGTDTILIDNVTNFVQIADGAELRVSGGAGNSQAVEFVPYDGDFYSRIRTVGIQGLRIGGSISSLDVEGSLRLEERLSAPSDVATFGQVWVNSSDNGLYYTNESGTDTRLDVTAGGTVTGSGSNNRIAVWSGTNSLDSSANLTFDGTSFVFSSSAFGQFRIDRQGTTTGASIGYQNDDGLKGYAGFNDSQQFEVWTSGASSTGFNVSNTGIVSANGLSLGDNDNITLGNSADATIDFDGTDLVITAPIAASVRIGNGADLRLNDGSNLYLEEASGVDSKIIFRNTGSAVAGGDIQFIDNSNNIEARIFYSSGLLDLVCDSTILLDSTNNHGQLNVSTNVLLADGETGSSVTAFRTQRRDAGNDNTSSAAVYGADGTLRDVGYNITPTQGLAPSTTYTLDKGDTSKYISKDGILAPSTVQCPQDTNIPVGFTVIVANDGTTTGNISITAGTGASLQWLDGSGSPPTGNRTLAIGGVCTLRKATNSGTHRWTIWGSGIT